MLQSFFGSIFILIFQELACLPLREYQDEIKLKKSRHVGLPLFTKGGKNS